MKPRHPTPEERKLWRESNRFTQDINDALDPDAAAIAPPATDALADATSAPSASVIQPRSGSLPKANRGEVPLTKPKAPPPPLDPLAAREAHKRFKAHPEIEATLDLHGMGKEEAYDAIARFLERAQKLGRRHVSIITGKGRGGEGILRRELPHWLNEPANRRRISAFAEASAREGGAGVTHVLVKKPHDR